MKRSYTTIFLLILLFSSTAHSSDSDYSLPETKKYIGTCYEAALGLHPGQVEQISYIHRGQISIFNLTVRTKNEIQWVITCDSSTGKIVRQVEFSSK